MLKTKSLVVFGVVALAAGQTALGHGEVRSYFHPGAGGIVDPSLPPEGFVVTDISIAGDTPRRLNLKEGVVPNVLRPD